MQLDFPLSLVLSAVFGFGGFFLFFGFLTEIIPKPSFSRFSFSQHPVELWTPALWNFSPIIKLCEATASALDKAALFTCILWVRPDKKVYMAWNTQLSAFTKTSVFSDQSGFLFFSTGQVPDWLTLIYLEEITVANE